MAPHHEDDDLAEDTATFIRRRNATNVVIPSERNGEGDCAVCGERENHLDDCATLLRRHGKKKEGEQCPICDRQLHSIITRRVGDTGVCLHCGDILNPLVTALANALLGRAKEFVRILNEDAVLTPTGYESALRDFVLTEITDNFAPLVTTDDLEMLRRITR